MTALLEVQPQTSSLRLVPQADAKLDAGQRRRLEQLDAFTAPWLEEKLLAKGAFASVEAYREAFVEFKKYVALLLLSETPLAMTSRPVDEVWHQFILFTREYMAFCDRVLGRYLHHVPKTSYTPLGEADSAAFFRWYETIFGNPSEIWERNATCNSCKGEVSATCTSCKGEILA